MIALLRHNGYRVLRLRGNSILIRPRTVLAGITLLLIVMVMAILAIPQGSFDLTSQQVWSVLMHPAAATQENRMIVWDIRVPRLGMALVCGAVLGMAGAAMQSITRNSLADPGLIGVKEGASITVLTILLTFPALGLFWRPLSGMAGGALAAAVVAAIARDLSRARFVLVGIGVSWLLSAAIAVFITTANIRDVQTALIWMAGSLHAATWTTLGLTTLWSALGVLLLCATARAADIAILGDGLCTSLGLKRRQLAVLRFIAPVVMTAASISAVGNLGFVGLIAPHMARFTLGCNQTPLLAGSALWGAALVLAADTFGRLAFAPLQIPAGIVLAVVGVPFFLLLLWQRRDRL